VLETDKAKPPVEQPDLKPTRSEEFEELWANNVLFESTLWNLRMIFGQVDLSGNQVLQHTAINMPWPQVKIAAYFIVANLMVQQALNGQIFLPAYVVPPRPEAGSPGFGSYDRRLVEYLGWIHDQFFGSSPYIPPEVAAYDPPPQS